MPEDTTSGNAYSVVLADLKAKRAQIDNAIAAIEGMLGLESTVNQQVSQGAVSPPSGEVTPGMFHGMSIAEAVRQLLAMRKKPMGTGDITQAIQVGGVVFTTETPSNTVSSVLNREAAKTTATVVSVGRGLWALPAWYPNPGRFQKKKAATGEAEAPEGSSEGLEDVRGEEKS